MNLLDLKIGEIGVIKEIDDVYFIKERLHSLGLIRGTKISLIEKSPFNSPRIYSYLNSNLALRNNIAKKIKIEK